MRRAAAAICALALAGDGGVLAQEPAASPPAAPAPLTAPPPAVDPLAGVKADYLYKFAGFVQWPTAAQVAADQPFALCVVGDDPFGVLLDQAVAGQKAGGRPVVVRRLARPAPEAGCQILYAAGSKDEPVAQLLREAHGLPALTVTDGAADPARGMVNFALREGHVRFEIDDAAAAESGLVISSKLLSLAVSVRPRK